MKKSRIVPKVITIVITIILLLLISYFIMHISTNLINNTGNKTTKILDNNKQYDIIIDNTYTVLDVRELQCGFINPMYKISIIIEDTNSCNRTYYKYETNNIDDNYINKAIVVPGDKIRFTDKNTFEIVE